MENHVRGSEIVYYLGLDLGGTKTEAAVVDKNGTILSSKRILTLGEDGPEKVLKRMCTLINEVVTEAKLNLESISGIGMGVPGAVDHSKGNIYFLTNLPGWTDFPIKDFLTSKYNMTVVLNNDANAAALAEYTFGNGAGTKHIIYLTVSTGIGGGLIVNGALFNGAWGAAGEVGHIVLDMDGDECNCGNRGCWETISSGSAIAKGVINRIKAGEKSKVTELAPLDDIKAEHVFIARAMGDIVSIEVTDRAMDFLGLGIANLVNVINPEKVIIGGGVAKVGDLLFSRVRERVKSLAYGPASKVEIQPVYLGTKTGVIGAATLAMVENKDY